MADHNGQGLQFWFKVYVQMFWYWGQWHGKEALYALGTVYMEKCQCGRIYKYNLDL